MMPSRLNNMVLYGMTLLKLGIPNLIRVGLYRLLLKTKLHPVQRIRPDRAPAGVFFPEVGTVKRNWPVPSSWNTSSIAFGHMERSIDDGAPDFLSDAVSGDHVAEADSAWWASVGQSTNSVEVKRIWEFSRFDWVLIFAQRAATGDRKSLDRLNAWLDSWILQNPAYLGPNWQCGQEASVRVLHLMVAAQILGVDQKPSTKLLWFVKTHLQRIAPTLSYAIGQDNNHATSEAAAMFAAGSLLRIAGVAEGAAWEQKGRSGLERCARRLISDDGTFSLYSLNYHRTVLDTLSFVEIWRMRAGLPAFTPDYLQKMSAATDWLRQMSDQISGDAPNLGANDGGRLLRLVDTPLRDYRPSIAVSHALFRDEDATSDNEMAIAALNWLGLKRPVNAANLLRSWHAAEGGFIVLREGLSMVMLRYPQFRFRPSHADGLHLDFWHDGQNILRDGGSYSYYADAELQKAFSGSAGHNSSKFDDEEPMPRLGAFLFGNWQQTIDVIAPSVDRAMQRASATMQNHSGAVHRRTVELLSNKLKVIDRLSGFKRKAVLRWRLVPGNWKLSGAVLTSEKFKIEIDSENEMEVRLHSGLESRHYLEKNEVPVIEIEIQKSGTIAMTLEHLA